MAEEKEEEPEEEPDQGAGEDEAAAEEGGEEGEGGKPKAHGKSKLFIIIGVAVLVTLGGLGAAYFIGLLNPVLDMIGRGGKGEAKSEGEAKGPVTVFFYDLQDMTVNLNATGGRRPGFSKIRVSLELQKKEDVAQVEQVLPRIVDSFQVFLRELRVDDLRGSAGLYRLREELLTRVTAAVSPVKVNDVLFKEILVQQ